jgi:hypothetical protein
MNSALRTSQFRESGEPRLYFTFRTTGTEVWDRTPAAGGVAVKVAVYVMSNVPLLEFLALTERNTVVVGLVTTTVLGTVQVDFGAIGVKAKW